MGSSFYANYVPFMQVWRFDDAPKSYQELSPHGGDEELVFFVPDNLKDDFDIEMLIDRHFSSYGDDFEDYAYKVEGGTVYISAHA